MKRGPGEAELEEGLGAEEQHPSKRARGDEAAEAPARDEHHDNGNGDTGGDSGPVDVSDDDDAPMMGHRASKEKRPGRECPFLDTVSRQNLDFDFEKCCSVSLSRVNVYACLVCGLYFQGRGPNTNAYAHALETNHHMFMKLEDTRAYCLPEGYEVIDRTLDDIRAVLQPKFSKEELKKIDSDKAYAWRRAIDGTDFMPGLVGLNNMKANDYVNVTVQMLSRVGALRAFFLDGSKYARCKSELVQRLGELMRKLWNPRNFKGQVSPHEFMRAVISESGKRFLIDNQSDPADFVAWLLNQVHLGLTGGHRKRRSVVTDAFQGEMEVVTEAGTGVAARSMEDVVQRVPFLMLALDLPVAPVFQDASEQNIIPQVMIQEVLQKYNGERITDDVKHGRRRFRIVRLPKHLLLHIRRFSRNQFLLEKNPTIVNFPVKNLDFAEHVPVEGVSSARYDLLSTVSHEGPTRIQVDKSIKAMPGTWRAFVHRKVEDLWYEVQDLNVTEVLPQAVALSEAYLQCYERRSD